MFKFKFKKKEKLSSETFVSGKSVLLHSALSRVIAPLELLKLAT